ncbi:MAG: zinc-ribbon domain-containing protein [Clostridia bacterium]|nr:zinc-ribbon domain-containing protein [Clostridia bacterium]
MFCTHCGTQVADTDKFCPNCGAPLIRPVTTLSPEPIPEEATPVGGVVPDAPVMTTPQSAIADSSPDKGSPTPAPKKKSHKALWIVLTCVALAVAVAVALIVWRPWSRNSKPDTPISEPEPMPTAVPVADLSPEEAVRAAFEKLNEADSMHVDFVEDASMTIGVPALGYSQDMNLSVVLDCDSDKANGMSRIEGSMSAMGYEQSVLTYAETVDGKVMAYTSTDDGKTWSLNGNDTLSDPTETIDLWTKHAKDFEKTGTEQVNGFDTTVCSGKLSGEYVKDAAGMTGGMFGTLDEAMLNDLDDLPITIWIDNESGRVVRMVLDMKNMMETLLEKALAESMGELPEGVEFSADVNKAEVVCDISQFNAIPPIVIPDEARGSGTAPEAEADGLVGTWTLCGGEDEQTQQYVDMILGLGMDMVFVFNEDGTGSMSMVFGEETDAKEFTYTLEGDKLVINGTGTPYRIEDGLLHLTADDANLIFKRK